MMNLFYLLYCSVPNWTLRDEEVENLLTVARRENDARQITGMLICFPDMYIQLIEGQEKDIRQLYLNLTADVRHSRVTLLKAGYANKRFFEDWSMGYNKKAISIEDTVKDFDFTDERVIEFFELIDQVD